MCVIGRKISIFFLMITFLSPYALTNTGILIFLPILLIFVWRSLAVICHPLDAVKQMYQRRNLNLPASAVASDATVSACASSPPLMERSSSADNSEVTSLEHSKPLCSAASPEISSFSSQNGSACITPFVNVQNISLAEEHSQRLFYVRALLLFCFL